MQRRINISPPYLHAYSNAHLKSTLRHSETHVLICLNIYLEWGVKCGVHGIEILQVNARNI